STVVLLAVQEPEEPHLLKINFSAPVTVECSEASGQTSVEPIAAEPLLLAMKTQLTFKGCKASEEHCAVFSSSLEELTAKEGVIETLALDGVPSLAEEEEGGVKVKRLDLTFES